MRIIYEPKGRAKEYSDLAANLFTGCEHGCKYCFCPAIMNKSLDEWKSNIYARDGVLKKLERDLIDMGGMGLFEEKPEIKKKLLLFSFMSDPYQSEGAALLTREALLLCEKYQMENVTVLTKNGERASNDFDILERNSWKFGTTICFRDENLRKEWEPGAPTIQSRIDAIDLAKKNGIFVWVSLEPVIDPEEAINVLFELKHQVDYWKIGKLNHNKEVEARVNWKTFLSDVRKELTGKDYYIKKDLLAYE